MLLATFLDPFHLVQNIVLALSIFNMVSFLWLTSTVWLNGDRAAGITRLGVVGLGFSALFFFIHALLISSPLVSASTPIPLDFLWRLIWLPALVVPYIWCAIGLHYAALINADWRKRRPLLLIIGGALGFLVLLLLLLNQQTFTYVGALRLLSDNDGFDEVRNGIFSPLLLIPILFLCYVTFCAIGPWFTSGRIARLVRVLWRALALRLHIKQAREGGLGKGVRHEERNGRTSVSSAQTGLRHALMDAFWEDPTDKGMLEEPLLSWHLARPGLLLAALLMVGLTTTLGILVVQSMVNWLSYGGHPAEHIAPGALLIGSTVPFNLLLLDLGATGAVALVILLIGYSIVRHGVLIERPLARQGFFEQWRGIVIVSTLVALLIVLLVNFTHGSLGGLMLITVLATVAYALFTWSTYTAHDRYIALLGPFVRSTSLRHWLNTDLQKTEQDLEHLFFHLCHDVLVVQCAYLSVMAGAVRRSFSYRWPASVALDARSILPARVSGSEGGASLSATPLPDAGQVPARAFSRYRKLAMNAVPSRVQLNLNDQPLLCWVLPIYNESGVVATLYLGPREDGGAFTDEDMNLAHACGQRILDTLGDHEAMQAVAGLLRRRVVDVKLLGAQQRRVLHDEILPQMHLALLQLERLRSLPVTSPEPVVQNGKVASKSASEPPNSSSPPVAASTTPTSTVPVNEKILAEAIDIISDAHRRLAAMMRAMTPGAPHRLERDGLMPAIHTMLEQDFQHAFDEVEWRVSDETSACIDEVTSPAIAELIFAAVQEALRNAARHARGSDVHRRLCLTLSATCNHTSPYLEVIVADDGVGITSTGGATTGTGGGLLTHSALLAIAGGSLTMKSTPNEGVTVKILLPTEALH